jgi:hypothetical protein
LELESGKLVVRDSQFLPHSTGNQVYPSTDQNCTPNLHSVHVIDPGPASPEVLGGANFVEASQLRCPQAFVKGRSGMAR